jgi:hypothetical protein
VSHSENLYDVKGIRVLACRVFQPELTSLGLPLEQVTYLDQGLHRYPDELRGTLAAALKEVERNPSTRRVLVAYGYCGGGLQGLTSHQAELLLPLSHDCIPLFSGKWTADPFVGCGGSFYLTPGWIEYGKTPFTEYFVSKKKFGHEDALWIGRKMLASYHEVVLIDTGVGLNDLHRSYARRMARLFSLNYREKRGCRKWLRRLLAGRPGPGLVLLPPNQPVDQTLYPQKERLPPQTTEGQR